MSACDSSDESPVPRQNTRLWSSSVEMTQTDGSFTLGSGLSKLEADALKLYLEGESYETMAERLGCDTKTIDNALQRVKRKVLAHQESRQVLQ